MTWGILLLFLSNFGESLQRNTENVTILFKLKWDWATNSLTTSSKIGIWSEVILGRAFWIIFGNISSQLEQYKNLSILLIEGFSWKFDQVNLTHINGPSIKHHLLMNSPNLIKLLDLRLLSFYSCQNLTTLKSPPMH